MVEVYKTNILKKQHAKLIKKEINTLFPKYSINFDLEDCDRILRIDTFEEMLDPNSIINILYKNGFTIEILSDEIPLSLFKT